MNGRLLRFLVLLVIGVGFAWVHTQYPLVKGLDLQGGTRVILEAQSRDDIVVDHNTIRGILSVIRNRVNAIGISEPLIQRKGVNQVVVELAGIKDPDRAIELIGQTALLEFVPADEVPVGLKDLPKAKQEILVGENPRLRSYKSYNANGEVVSERLLSLGDTVLTGGDLKTASPGTDQFGRPVVQFEFKTEAAQTFYELTKEQQGKPIVILLDDEIVSAPVVNKPISGGRGIIEGQFDLQEMSDMVIKLKAGSLPAPVEIVSNTVVGPSLGADSISRSQTAGIVGLALVSIYMLFVYRMAGLVADIALAFYLFLLLGVLKFLGATLTLPGIAGIILTIGMAVDANVIIFERIREQLRLGDTFLSGIRTGFSKAIVAILDSNVTTLLAAALLFWLGTGTIKGFALTLSIGILVSMFTAIFVTQFLIEGLASVKGIPRKWLFKEGA